MALITLEQAAELLGITTDELVEMRERNDIHGYRDGSSWKFKQDEVDRVKSEMGGPGSPDLDEDDASILVSEEELGLSTDGAKSTIIGKKGNADDAPDSDLNLVESDDMSDAGGSLNEESNLELSTNSETGSGDDLNLDSNLESGDLDLASDLALGSGDFSLDDDDDELALGEDDDSDLVLGGSGGLESDITLGSATDTGINLLSPSDSGLSLEEEPGLGTDVGSLELPEDEEDIEIGSESEFQADDEFMLSQPDEMSDDDDSGSQVIALEESAAFDQDAATMLQAGEEDLLSEDPAVEAGAFGQMEQGGFADLGADMAAGAGMAAAGGAVAAGGAMAAVSADDMPMPAAPTVTEAPYTLLNVLGLLCIVICLSLAGMLMVDVARNMWAWQEGVSVSTGMTDGIIGALGLNN